MTKLKMKSNEKITKFWDIHNLIKSNIKDSNYPIQPKITTYNASFEVKK